VNDLRRQLRVRETDFENRVRALHSAEVVKLKSTLETNSDGARKFKESAARSAAESCRRADEVDALRAKLASESIRHEAVLAEAGHAAANALKIAVATKVRVIANPGTRSCSRRGRPPTRSRWSSTRRGS
jgi:hypothetical protein